MSEWPFIIAAYAAAWLVLAGYGFYLSGRARRSEIEAAAAQADQER